MLKDMYTFDIGDSIRKNLGESTNSSIAVNLDPEGSLILYPEYWDESGGGISGPEPADASITKMYCLNPCGNGAMSGLRTYKGGEVGKGGGIGISWHSDGLLAKFDPITMSDHKIALTTFGTITPYIFYIIALTCFIFTIIILCIAIIMLFVPGT